MFAGSVSGLTVGSCTKSSFLTLVSTGAGGAATTGGGVLSTTAAGCVTGLGFFGKAIANRPTTTTHNVHAKASEVFFICGTPYLVLIIQPRCHPERRRARRTRASSSIDGSFAVFAAQDDTRHIHSLFFDQPGSLFSPLKVSCSISVPSMLIR